MTLNVLKLLVPTDYSTKTFHQACCLTIAIGPNALKAGRQAARVEICTCLGRPMLPRVLLSRCSNSMQDTIGSFRIGIQNQPFSMGKKMLLQIFPHFRLVHWKRVKKIKDRSSSIWLKFIYSEDTKFCEIFTSLLSYRVPVNSKVKIQQNFVASLEYMNFKSCLKPF